MCLQVCEWIYPLYPDSPVFLSNKGVFTFPNTSSAVPGSYVGVVLSSELPASDRDLFQEQLSALAQLRVQVPNLKFDFAKIYDYLKKWSNQQFYWTLNLCTWFCVAHFCYVLLITEGFSFKVDEDQGGTAGKDINLSGKVPPSETPLTQTPGGEEKTVPLWSEKISQNILAGLNFKIKVM